MLDRACRCLMGLGLADMKPFGIVVASGGVVPSPISRLHLMSPRSHCTFLGSRRELLER